MFLNIVGAIQYLSFWCIATIGFNTRPIGGQRKPPTGQPWIGYEYLPEYATRSGGQPSAFTGRHDRDAIDLYKQYKDSIYVSRWYNASFVCQIPFFTLTFPQRSSSGLVEPVNAGLNIGQPFIHALFALAGVALFSPIIFPENRRRNGGQSSIPLPVPDIATINQFLERQMQHLSKSAASGRLGRNRERRSMFYFLGQHFQLSFESVLKSIDQSVDALLPSFAGRKLRHCFQMSVCQLYNRPKQYGTVGLLFRAVFPYNLTTDTSVTSADIVSHYRSAAIYGRDRSNDCFNRYSGCSFQPLEVLRKLLIWVVRRSDHKVSETQRKVLLYLTDQVFGYLMP